MALNWEPKSRRFKRDESIYVGGSTFNNIGRDQLTYIRFSSSKASEGPHGQDIELGSHSRDMPFSFGFDPEELEPDPIPNINIPSDVNSQSDGTLTPVSVALDDVHPASQDEVFPTVTLSEHNTEPPHNGVVLDSLNVQPAFAEPTNPCPTFVYVLDRTATLIPSHPSDAIEALNAEAEAREARLRRGRIERRTNNAVNWVQQIYGSNDDLDKYMNQFPASDIIRRPCAELRELCGM